MTEEDAGDPDLPLVARFCAGDRGAFELLVRRHQRGLWRIARRYVHNDADAHDIAQQAFVRAFQALGGFRAAASVRSWLYRIAINLALNLVRDRGRETLDDGAQSGDDERHARDATGAQRLIDDEDAAALRAAITELPAKQRMVLELRVFDELSFREVAELVDCTENAAKVNFHYAVKRLRELLAEDTP